MDEQKEVKPIEKPEEPKKNWIEEESEQFKNEHDYEELPSLQLKQNEVTEVEIEFSEEFHKWQGEQGGKTIVKKIVPVLVGETRMNWWLNVKNPIYREIINAGISGQKKFKILQTGSQANTKYVLVK